MSSEDNGVVELLRRASDDLSPDVGRLVAGGITRGRSRQRRARIGTAVASVAVIGVVGGLAAVVPLLGSSPQDGDAGLADDGVVASDTSSPTPTVTPTMLALTIKAADVPAAVDTLLGTNLAGPPLLEPPYGVRDTADEKVVHFLYRGMLTSVVIERQAPPAGATDGTVTEASGPTTADGVTAQSATVWRYGFMITVMSYNAAEGKESPTLQPDPALTHDQLATIAGSDIWFG